MAGVLPPLVFRIVAHRVADRERACEDDRILRLDLVEPHLAVQAGDPLRRLHLVALREAVSRRRAVRWVDDEGGLTLRRARVGHTREERPAVLALLDQLPAEVPAAGGGVDALLELRFCPERLVHVAGRAAESGGVGTPFQRDA